MLIGGIILPRLFLHVEGKEQSDKQPIPFLLQLPECPQGKKNSVGRQQNFDQVFRPLDCWASLTVGLFWFSTIDS